MQSHAHEENNVNYLHTTMGSKLAITAQGRALGTNVGRSLEMSAQCSAAVKKANQMLAMIKRGTRGEIRTCHYSPVSIRRVPMFDIAISYE